MSFSNRQSVSKIYSFDDVINFVGNEDINKWMNDTLARIFNNGKSFWVMKSVDKNRIKIDCMKKLPEDLDKKIKKH